MATSTMQNLRALGVVAKLVEFYGAGCASLSIADRATIANMTPGEFCRKLG